MANEMIERVAKSLYGGGYRHLAKLAITAMREPTEAMLNAGADSIDMQEVWQHMIDAALKDD